MIKQLDSSTKELLILEARGEITADDYKDTLVPLMEKLLEDNGDIRCVITFDESFTNFTLGAIAQDGLFGMHNITAFKKISIVGLHNWMEELVKMAEFFMPNVIKKFEPEQMQEAIEWANS